MREISSTLRLNKVEGRSGKRLLFDRVDAPFVVLLMLIISGGYMPRPINSFYPTATGQIMRLTISSTIYRQAVPVNVYLPPCYASSADRLRVIFLLHGSGADETQWPDLRVQAEADALIANGAQPFVVVMPGGVYRTDQNYASFMLDDLIPALNRLLHL